MATYKVTVATGDMVEAGTNNSISITLVGTYGESRQTTVSFLFLPGKERSLSVHCGQDLGPIVLIRLHKWRLFLEDAWFCKDVRVAAPNGTLYRFPCYQWLEGVRLLTPPFFLGKKLVDDKLQILKEHRHRELAARQEAYRPWRTWVMAGKGATEAKKRAEVPPLPCRGASHFLSGFLLRRSSWNSLDEMRTIFSRTQVPEYVAKHWQEDDFFGSQFLTGNNPIIIHRCTTLPLKFPVTPEMVAGSLGGGTDLGKELQEGRIFIVDYKVLEDIPTDTIYGRQQYIAAPLCLLHQGTDGLLRPIAIQLSQTPGPHSPIFLPSDDEWDWLLAKTWVRNADFYSHQLLTHLLRTHLFGEVFAIATLRHLPTCHPLFKLLMPHFHFTLHINTLARSVLINQGGLIDKGSGVTYEGLLLVVQRGLEQVTYTSLCLPDDIRHRGMSHVPNYYYRDDGMSLWEAIESFVTGIVTFYYDGDAAVNGDTELQAWVMDIFTNGSWLSHPHPGIPSSLQTVVELIKFLTMVMFTCSVQHAAVNNGQYDLGAFVPNAPSSMRHPPPSEKGRAFLQVHVAVCLQRLLGQYPEEWFTEAEPRRLIRAFQGRLEEIRDRIEERNQQAELRYNYLNPLETENSISI
uniref:Arachidonate 15-lipoxygenase type B n=1 Tax=Junco hyemalis TaxID=40217 RepID=A0A8C5JUG7_JUNHY